MYVDTEKRTLKCKRCNNHWDTRLIDRDPKACRYCNSPQWDIDRPEKIKCLVCNGEWQGRIIENKQQRCRLCNSTRYSSGVKKVRCVKCNSCWISYKEYETMKCHYCKHSGSLSFE